MRHEGLVNGAFMMAPVRTVAVRAERAALYRRAAALPAAPHRGCRLPARHLLRAAHRLAFAVPVRQVGNFIVAVMGPLLDSGYHEVPLSAAPWVEWESAGSWEAAAVQRRAAAPRAALLLVRWALHAPAPTQPPRRTPSEFCPTVGRCATCGSDLLSLCGLPSSSSRFNAR